MHQLTDPCRDTIMDFENEGWFDGFESDTMSIASVTSVQQLHTPWETAETQWDDSFLSGRAGSLPRRLPRTLQRHPKLARRSDSFSYFDDAVVPGDGDFWSPAASTNSKFNVEFVATLLQQLKDDKALTDKKKTLIFYLTMSTAGIVLIIACLMYGVIPTKLSNSPPTSVSFSKHSTNLPSDFSIPSKAADLISTTHKPILHLLHLVAQTPDSTTLVVAAMHASALSTGILINSNFSRKIEISKKWDQLSEIFTDISVLQPEIKAQMYYQTEPIVARFQRIIASLHILNSLAFDEPPRTIFGLIKSIFTFGTPRGSNTANNYEKKVKLEYEIKELIEITVDDANEGLQSLAISLTQFNEYISHAIILYSELSSDLAKEQSIISSTSTNLQNSLTAGNWGWLSSSSTNKRNIEKLLKKMDQELEYLKTVREGLENSVKDIVVGMRRGVADVLAHLKVLRKRLVLVGEVGDSFPDWGRQIENLETSVDRMKGAVEKSAF